MSILTKVERKSTGGRLFLAGVFAAILAGSVTMVYPFLLMLSGSMRSDMDISNMSILPAFLTEDDVLVQKFLETKYDYDPTQMNLYRQTRDYSFQQAAIPPVESPQRVEDFRAFANGSDIPNHWHILGGTRLWKLMRSDILTTLQDRVREHYNGDLAALSRDIGTTMVTWSQLEVLPPDWANRRYDHTPSPVFDIYFEILHERPVADRAVVSLTGEFLDNVIYPAYGMSSVDEYNANHKVPITAYETFSIPRRVPGPDQPNLRAEWLQFVMDNCHMSFVRADVDPSLYQDFVRQRFRTIDNLKQYWPNSPVESFDEVELPGPREWLIAERANVYRDFIETLAPEQLHLVGPEFAWRDYLEQKYNGLDSLNQAWDADVAAWDTVQMPQAQVETAYVYGNTGKLRWRFATKNFRIVIQEIFIQGRPFYNTMVYVILALCFSLTVQPMAAYALSRYNPPGMWKLIFIFMATMAFPPMVATIPMFLMIKKLNLLNTFIALVLPVTINGYLIFLLKGFFDSIPKHLYEAAQIEGASEMHMFWHITMALSKPILAVVALNTFRMAWMAFMYPLIVCPDEKMHVLAVWLHQFQADAPTSAVFASILVASVPTLLIFIFTQGTIMRGIAVPAEK